ncbi:PQQ-binding-like beta-propeller repeat protein [Streptomyces sp. NPDC127066]|uniref:outer membrane protein assembly factor BamB family protein n=1 Tax=Streptomyces sp. NPDC127066 TaxID=3347125 RepID=UPI003659F372
MAYGLSLRWTGFGVTALNLRTGKEHWRHERREPKDAVMEFKVSERTAVVGHHDGRLVGIDLRTGKLLAALYDHRILAADPPVLCGDQQVVSCPDS